MSPRVQRIAIAEMLGYPGPFEDFGWGNGPDLFAMDNREVPDYPNDLNAMHEAEKVLTKEQRLTYLNYLHCTPGLSSAPFATAAQRAEAFLRTLEKWEDTK